MDKLEKQLIDLFINLTASGVIFFYGDEEIEYGEITDIVSCNNEFITIKIEEEIEKCIKLNEFKNLHSKENINLYDWIEIREFDKLIEELEQYV